MTELRYALRYLRKSPGYSAAAILTLAIAIGANSAIFSAVYGVLLRPLPILEADRLAVLWDSDPARNVPVIELSYRQYERWAGVSRIFDDAAAVGASTWPVLLERGGESTRLSLAGVSSSFFDTFGTTPLMGRGFRSTDDVRGAEKVVVLSYGVWTRLFGGDPSVIGRVVQMGEPRTIVGVMPDGFEFPRGTDVWMPVVPILADSGSKWDTEALEKVGVLFVVGRLRPGITSDVAAGDLGVVTPPDSPGRFGNRVIVTPFVPYFFGPVRQALLALFASVALLLLIACANVSGLMLGRVSARRGEDAMRLALGATRGAISRQWAFETSIVCLVGGLLGLGVGAALTRGIVALAPAGIPRADAITFNLPVAAFTLAVTAAAALLCAMLPVRQASAGSVAHLLGGARVTRSRRTARGRSLLAVSQVAFSLALISTAALVVRSFVNLRGIDLGFSPAGVLSLSVEPRSVDAARVNTWVEELTERIRVRPGVQAAGAVLLRPLALGPIGWDSWVLVEGQTNDQKTRGSAPTVNYQVATPGYFETMRIAVLRGRAFNSQDRRGQPRVAVVSASTARRLWPGREPVGQRLLMPTFVPGDKVPVWRTVVGVVSDVRYRGLADLRLDVYDPAGQAPLAATDIVVRGAGDPAQLLGAVQSESRALDARVVFDRVATMQGIIDRETAPWRFSVWVLSLFGAVAFSLAGLGLFALVSLDVAERDREFAIRLALGAQRADVISSALGATAVRVAAGIALGLGGAALLARGLGALLFGVAPADPASFAAAAALVAVVAAIAALIPAVRASAIEPLKLLRGDSSK